MAFACTQIIATCEPTRRYGPLLLSLRQDVMADSKVQRLKEGCMQYEAMGMVSHYKVYEALSTEY